MKRYNTINSNLENYVPDDWRKASLEDVRKVWEPRLEWLRDLLGVNDMVPILERNGVKTDQLVEEEFVETGTWKGGMIWRERAVAKKGKYVMKRGYSTYVEGPMMDQVLVPYQYIDVAIRDVLKNEMHRRLRVEDYPELYEDERKEMSVRIDKGTLDNLVDMGYIDREKREEITQGVKKVVTRRKWKIHFYPNSDGVDVFLDTEIGCGFLDLKALMKGDIEGFENNEDKYYRSQFRYYMKEQGATWKMYKQAVKETREYKAAMRMARDFIKRKEERDGQDKDI